MFAILILLGKKHTTYISDTNKLTKCFSFKKFRCQKMYIAVSHRAYACCRCGDGQQVHVLPQWSVPHPPGQKHEGCHREQDEDQDKVPRQAHGQITDGLENGE